MSEKSGVDRTYGRAEAIRLIRSVMNAREWSAARLAKEAGVAPSTITRALDPNGQFMPSMRTIQKIVPLAVYARIDAVDEVQKVEDAYRRQISEAGLIPFAGEVQPGHWVRLEHKRADIKPVMIRDDDLPDGNLAAFKVPGNEYEPEIPQGSWLIVLKTGPRGLQLYDGDITVIRQRVDTTLDSLVETSLWRVIVSENNEMDAEALAPDLHPPKPDGLIWRRASADLVGVVVASYHRRVRNAARPAPSIE